MGVKENIERVRDKIAKAAERVGRNPDEIRILGATKKVKVDRIRQAIDAGLRLFGENRVQEGIPKVEALADENVEFHFIGVLQSNKVRKAVKYFSAIHSVSSLKLAKKINAVAEEMRMVYPVFFEINLSGEETKSGFSLKEFMENIEELSSLKNVKPVGLMTMPPLQENPRPYFIKLRELLEEVKGYFGRDFKELSMGMSDDFEIAVEEGATIVRLGRVIFGERE